MSSPRALVRYLAARLALAPVMLWLIASLVFLLLRVAPGDPIDALLGTRAPAAARAALRAQLGLDQPLWIQYGHFLGHLLRGDLGQSLTNQEPVRAVIGQSLPASLELGIVALALAAVVGLAVGFSGVARPEGTTVTGCCAVVDSSTTGLRRVQGLKEAGKSSFTVSPLESTS